MGKKKRRGGRGKRSKAKKSNVSLAPDYYDDYVDDPIALLQDGAYEELHQLEVRQNGEALSPPSNALKKALKVALKDTLKSTLHDTLRTALKEVLEETLEEVLEETLPDILKKKPDYKFEDDGIPF